MPRSDPEYDALYAAVCASPADDTARLVLADWLDEHDDPHRAAFIRAQVGLAQAREADPHAAAVFDFFSAGFRVWSRYADPAAISPAVAHMAELSKLANKNETKARARWKAVLPRRKAGRVYSYERGFPYGIAISDAKLYADAAAKEQTENLPGYELYVMSGNEPGFDALLACGRLAGARGFGLFGADSADMMRKLGQRAEVRNVRSLNLRTSSATDSLAAIAGAPNWSGLTHLDVSTWLNDADLPPEFSHAHHLRTLTSLNLSLGRVSGASLAALARMKWPNLRNLQLDRGEVDAAGARGLATGDFPELRSLEIGNNRIGNDGAKALADGRKLSSLATLDLPGNRITDAKAMASLIAGPAFRVLA